MNPAQPSGARSSSPTRSPSPRPPARLSLVPLPEMPTSTTASTPTRIASSASSTPGPLARSLVLWPEPVELDRVPATAVAPSLPARPPVGGHASREVVLGRMQPRSAPVSRSGRPPDYRFDGLLQGVVPGVFQRIVSLHEALDDNNVSSTRSADPTRLTNSQVFAMSNAWQTACATGSALIRGDDRHVRTSAVGIQHFVEQWLTKRLGGTAPFAVVAAIHTPAPPSPLRHWADAPAAATLLAPHLRDDASMPATIEQRARSVRDLLAAGATLHACYSAASLETLDTDESAIYRSTCEAYPNLIDAPSVLSPDAFRASCGATYLFGTSPLSLTGCFAIRLPQAADAVQGYAEANLFVATPLDESFKRVLDELSQAIGLTLDPAYGGVAMRAMVDEPEYV